MCFTSINVQCWIIRDDPLLLGVSMPFLPDMLLYNPHTPGKGKGCGAWQHIPLHRAGTMYHFTGESNKCVFYLLAFYCSSRAFSFGSLFTLLPLFLKILTLSLSLFLLVLCLSKARFPNFSRNLYLTPSSPLCNHILFTSTSTKVRTAVTSTLRTQKTQLRPPSHILVFMHRIIVTRKFVHKTP